MPLLLLILAACGSDPTRAAGPVLRILTTELPSAAVTKSYSATLVAQGGVAPYLWTVASGALPPGLALNAATGVISGTPAQQGTFSFVAQVRDASDSTVVRPFTLDVTTTAVADVTITLNGATHQTWRAWRFTVRGNKNVDGDCSRTADAVVNAYLNEVVDNLGFTGIRLEQHYLQSLEAAANDNSDPFTLNMAGFVGGLDAPLVFNNCPIYARTDMIDRTIVPMRNRVMARGEPFDLYISFVYFQFNRLPAWWRNDPQEAAEAVEAYVTWFRQYYGIAPDWFTYNEPDGGHFDNSWMGQVTVALGQRFGRLGVNTKIEQPSSSTPGGAINAFDNIARVAGATALVRRVGFHGYDYYGLLWPDANGIRNRNELRNRARAIGAETAMSEICCKPGWDGGYDTGRSYARDIFLNMVEADVSIWEPLGIYNICKASGCPVGAGSGQNLVNIDPSLSTFYFNPAFWVVRQFSRYIRPGYVRVGLNCSGCTATTDRGPALKAVAWQSPGHKLVMILINDSGAALTTTITGIGSGPLDLNKLDPSMCRASGPRDRCTPVVTTVTANGSITVTLPPDAVWAVRQP